MSSEIEKCFPCDICQKSFKNKSLLTRHISDVHLKLKPFGCSLCPCKFGQQGSLNRHIRTVHKLAQDLEEFKTKSPVYEKDDKGENNRKIVKDPKIISNRITNPDLAMFSCDSCGKKFSRRDNLKKHETTVHLNIKPYECTYDNCAFKATYQSDLNTHINRIHLKLPHLEYIKKQEAKRKAKQEKREQRKREKAEILKSRRAKQSKFTNYYKETEEEDIEDFSSLFIPEVVMSEEEEREQDNEEEDESEHFIIGDGDEEEEESEHFIIEENMNDPLNVTSDEES